MTTNRQNHLVIILSSLVAILFVTILYLLYVANIPKPTSIVVALPSPAPTQIPATTAPTPTPGKNISSIKYVLPSGWKTVTHPSGLFSVGYNPSTQYIETDDQSISLIYKNTLNNPYYSPYASTQKFNILPYDNGSRHKFIETQLGESLNSGNKWPGYYKSEFYIDGKNCLVLNGVSISQFYTVWGMCAINSKQALLFTSFNYANLSQHLSSLSFK
jgi:hypothetical protein